MHISRKFCPLYCGPYILRGYRDTSSCLLSDEQGTPLSGLVNARKLKLLPAKLEHLQTRVYEPPYFKTSSLPSGIATRSQTMANEEGSKCQIDHETEPILDKLPLELPARRDPWPIPRSPTDRPGSSNSASNRPQLDSTVTDVTTENECENEALPEPVAEQLTRSAVDNEGRYVTHSGRTVIPPDRLMY
jgi:hypothetical protein